MPTLTDANKQRLVDEIEAHRDRNDWISDPKHVYRRAILKTQMPSWAESAELMEANYRPIWKPSTLDRQWREPTEDEIWAFPKSIFTGRAAGRVLTGPEICTEISKPCPEIWAHPGLSRKTTSKEQKNAQKLGERKR
jgi:hypothetical protein